MSSFHYVLIIGWRFLWGRYYFNMRAGFCKVLKNFLSDAAIRKNRINGLQRGIGDERRCIKFLRISQNIDLVRPFEKRSHTSSLFVHRSS